MRKNQYSVKTLGLIENDQVKWIIWMVLSSLIGIFIALNKRYYEPLFYNLYQFVGMEMVLDSRFLIIKDSFVNYGFQLGGLWACGLFDMGKYVETALFITIGVVYSFTVTSLMLLYGMKGILVVLGMLSIQMIIVLLTMIYVVTRAKKEKATYKTLLGIVGVVTFLSCYNAFVQPLIEKMLIL